MAKKSSKEAENNLAVLKQDLKSGQFGQLYLFYGEEKYLREHYLEQLKKKLLDGPAADFNYHRFSPQMVDLQALSDSVEALPMMAERSLVEIDDWDPSSLPEDSREILTGILSDIPDYCTMVFVFDTVEYKIDGRQKKLKQAFDKGLAVEFAHQSQRELSTWIRRHFQNLGKRIGDRECEYLTFVTGGDMTTLSTEISKVAAYAAGEEITEPDIRAVVIPVLDAEIFDITDAIAAGNYEKALLKLRTLLQMQQKPVYLLAAIGSALRRLLYARACMAAGKGESTLSEMLRSANGKTPHPYVLKTTMATARKVSDSFCSRAVVLCMEADIRLKRFSGDDQRTLELLLLELAQEVRRG